MNDLDYISERLADQLIVEQCGCSLHKHLPHVITDHILNHVKQAQEEGEVSKEEAEKKARHDALFNSLFTALKPHEEKMKAMLRGIWEQERKIVIANLKKMKKAWLRKDAIDNILYPQGQFVRKISDGTSTIFEATMESEAQRVTDLYGLDVAFDVENPEVQKWLKGYTMKFAKELERVSHEKLRRILMQSMDEGLGIPQIMKKILGEFESWSRFRAELVSRSEIIRASNAGAKNVFLQSGVVERIEWVAFYDDRLCPFCEQLDGRVIKITENFLNLGDELTAKVDGKSQTLKVTYTDVEYPPAHSLCYDKETEVYTSKGWQYFSELTGKEKCLSLNPENLNLSYQPIKNKISYHYTGDMIHFNSRSLDLKVTPDHQMFYKKRWSHRVGRKDEYLFTNADQLPPEAWIYRSSQWQGKTRQYINIGNLKIETETFCRLMGYYLSEGNVNLRKSRYYQISIAQSNNANRHRMFCYLLALPFRIAYGKEKLCFYNTDLGQYLEQFGKSPDKYIPQEIKNLNPKQIDLFLDAFCLGDGTIQKGKAWKGGNFKPRRVFSTSSKRMADDIGELLLKIGKRPSYRLDKRKGTKQKFRNGTYTLNHDIWIITECHRQASTYFKRDRVPYDDMVYCVELPKYHTLWIRRNGKTAWSGNCRCTIVANFG